MRTRDLELFGLLPTLGLFGCAAANATMPAQVGGPDPLESAALPLVDAWIEQESSVEPLTVSEAAQLSMKQALAAGHYAAAAQSATVAQEYEPELASLRLAEADALLGLGDLSQVEHVLRRLEYDELISADEVEESLSSRRMLLHELDHDTGTAACEAKVESSAVPLQSHDDFFSVWNELNSRLSSSAGLKIPTDESQAREQLCSDGCHEELSFVRIDGSEDSIVGLLVRAEDGALFLVPELLHPQVDETCEDETLFGLERHGQLVRVRSFADIVEVPKTEDWRLGIEAELGAIQAKIAAASGYGSSGYGSSGSSGYGSSGSSGYGSSGYASSGYGSSGCSGGYDYDYGYYDYGYCEPVRGIERDTFIDLSRGEVVLDIVRTGPSDAGLGSVALDAGQVGIDACGVEQTLALSWTV